jgi:DNA-binding transcriptional ArsR family regulator
MNAMTDTQLFGLRHFPQTPDRPDVAPFDHVRFKASVEPLVGRKRWRQVLVLPASISEKFEILYAEALAAEGRIAAHEKALAEKKKAREKRLADRVRHQQRGHAHSGKFRAGMMGHKILMLIAQGPKRTGEVVEVIDAAEPSVSRTLRSLLSCGYVKQEDTWRGAYFITAEGLAFLDRVES